MHLESSTDSDGDVVMESNIRKHQECPMRHENGNCNPVGGFCTAVNSGLCDALIKSYEIGFHDGAMAKNRKEDCGERV